MQRMRIPTYPILKSRWTALVLVFGLSAVILLWALGYGRAAAWGLVVIPAAIVIGLLRPDATLRSFEGWDRLARHARRAARLWLTGLVFASIGTIGLLGSRLRLARPATVDSGWFPKRALPEGSYSGDADVSYGSGAPSWWVRRYVEWAWRSGNAWSWSLLPALILLKMVEGESRGSLGGDVYTLY